MNGEEEEIYLYGNIKKTLRTFNIYLVTLMPLSLMFTLFTHSFAVSYSLPNLFELFKAFIALSRAELANDIRSNNVKYMLLSGLDIR